MSSTTRIGTSDTPTKKPLNGFFQNGQWLCNCTPRLPAIQFQVKRDSPNKGRWFYTCQKDRSKGRPGEPENCGFFLWAEKARQREEAALLSNSHTEPRTPRKRMRQTTLSTTVTPREGPPRPKGVTPITPISHMPDSTGSTATIGPSSRSTGSSATLGVSDKNEVDQKDDDLFGEFWGSDEDDELTRLVDAVETPMKAAKPSVRAGSKRRRSNDEADEFSDLSSGEERQLATITDSSSQRDPKGKDSFATPSTVRTTDNVGGLATPSLTGKPVRRVLFTEPEVASAKRQRTDEAGSFARAHSSTPSSSQEMHTPSSVSGNITEEIMAALKGHSVDEKTLREVKDICEKHAAKAKGLERGRDAARQAAKTKDAKISELQQKITDLENGRKLDADVRRKTRTELMRLWSEN